MISWHVQCPFVRFNLEAGCIWWDDKTTYAFLIAVLPGCASKDEAVGGMVHSSLPSLCSVY